MLVSARVLFKKCTTQTWSTNKLDRVHMIFFQKQLWSKESITISNWKMHLLRCFYYHFDFKPFRIQRPWSDKTLFSWVIRSSLSLRFDCFQTQKRIYNTLTFPLRQVFFLTNLSSFFFWWWGSANLERAPAVSGSKTSEMICSCSRQQKMRRRPSFAVVDVLCFFRNSELCMIYMETLAIISFLLERFILCWPIPKCGSLSKNLLHHHLYIYTPLKYTNSKTGCWTRHLGGNTRLEKTRGWKAGPWLEVVPTYGTLLPRFPIKATSSRSCQGWFGSPPLGCKLLVS